MTVEPSLWPAARVARRLGLTYQTFRRHRPALHRRGFPEPVLVLGAASAPRCWWRGAEVEAWLAAGQGLPPATHADPELAQRARALT